MLPDDVLLAIFDSYLREKNLYSYGPTQAWQSLIHVCRRWRSVVLGSPRHLDLRLCYIASTRSRHTLDIWPALPVVIKGDGGNSTIGADNVAAALKCSDRVCEISLTISKILDWEILLAAMQQPFPELTDLGLWWFGRIDETEVVPDSFLGGFAPNLEFFLLDGIPFPGFPKLLLSATHLVNLRLYNIPHSGYFSPDAMVAALSTLTSLKYLSLSFNSPESCPDLETRRLPPSTRSVLPILTKLSFKGVSEYLEDLLTGIDAPQLNSFSINFFNDIVFDTPELIRFISQTPVSSALEIVHIVLDDGTAGATFRPKIHGHVELWVSILCEGLEWMLSCLEQVCTSCLPFLSTLEDLYIHEDTRSLPDWKDNIENRVLWLGLLHPFTAVKNLYLSEQIALRIGPALQELIEGRATEVFPTLENIFLQGLKSSGRAPEGIGLFVAARQSASHHPIAISPWTNSRQDMDQLRTQRRFRW